MFGRALPDRLLVGLRLRETHTNTRGSAHGGLIAAPGDWAMGLSSAIVRGMSPKGIDLASFVTVSLSVDCLDTALVGPWLVIDTNYVKARRSLCFARADLTADGGLIARAHATLRVMTPRS
jgi:acyl-coenzyme A thioesterase PaaI-like protein